MANPPHRTTGRIGMPFIRDGKPFEHFSFSASLQEEIKQLFLPVVIGDTGTAWSVVVNLPVDKVEVPKNELRNFIVLGSLGLLAVLLIALWLASREVVGKPLQRIITTVRALTSGDRRGNRVKHMFSQLRIIIWLRNSHYVDLFFNLLFDKSTDRRAT